MESMDLKSVQHIFFQMDTRTKLKTSKIFISFTGFRNNNVLSYFNRGRVSTEFSFSISITLESGFFFQTKQEDPVNIVTQSSFKNRISYSPMLFSVLMINFSVLMINFRL